MIESNKTFFPIGSFDILKLCNFFKRSWQHMKNTILVYTSKSRLVWRIEDCMSRLRLNALYKNMERTTFSSYISLPSDDAIFYSTWRCVLWENERCSIIISRKWSALATKNNFCLQHSILETVLTVIPRTSHSDLFRIRSLLCLKGFKKSNYNC